MTIYRETRELLLEWKVRDVIAKGALVFPSLVRCLGDPDDDVRLRAADAIANAADHGCEYDWRPAVQPLLRRFNDDNLFVRANCAYAIGNIAAKYPEHDWSEPARAIFGLLKYANEGRNHPEANEYMRSSASKALVAMGREAVPYLAEALKDEKQGARLAAIELLGRIKDPSSLTVLLDAFKDALTNEDFDVKNKALSAVKELARTTEIDLRQVESAIGWHIANIRKKGSSAAAAVATKTATTWYLDLCGIVRELLARKYSGMEGVLLEASIRPPRNKTYRAPREARMMA